MDSSGFFKDLFDFEFKKFITLKFIKIIYIIATAVIAVGALIFMVGAVAQGGASVFVGLIVVPLIALMYVIWLRISLEVIAILFRMGTDIG